MTTSMSGVRLFTRAAPRCVHLRHHDVENQHVEGAVGDLGERLAPLCTASVR